MYNKKKGITLIELVISIAILSIALTVIYSFFSTDYKAINKAQVELELQSEAEKAIEKISDIAIQSSKMEKNKTNNIKFIKENIEYEFILSGENNAKKNKKLYLQVDNTDKIEIAKYIEDIIYNKTEQRDKIIGVEIEIKLEKNDIKKNIKTKVYFRNVS
ncbi:MULTISPECIES: type II secretion system protein [Clostridium]|uniref:type II secretion system protein n=1 Tax=Clostridium TaxID=1485 RepID=UPI0013E8F693|nr:MULTISPECIES: type II secretion system protein [Clostridium]MBU3127721.1 type II secretion system GspH family protein [Clostridium tagluense]MBZ9636284.1 type II secretion system GspH family protein [Clostridium sp. FP1]